MADWAYKLAPGSFRRTKSSKARFALDVSGKATVHVQKTFLEANVILRMMTTASSAMVSKARIMLPLVMVVGLAAQPVDCEPVHVITVQPGATEDLYFQFNLSGNVYVKIGTKDAGEPCAEFWWITWPLGRVEALGRPCGFATFEIPGFSKFAISSKLRVGGTKTLTDLAPVSRIP
ncbi:hypothetical protein [Paraburkholderia sp. MM5384-R2]|uniref:hypothetical protein n=1 Tax=Paraburkholderia sp. MM5384-R2 TaxID=2723097 RepID=UPI00161C7E0C|nr:hypothetical protein [Paraburkholderia sp. MM5384-R2]MBB5503708.1 hypothetical protein [Paraburkholderia sp. MM5384-R2]